ncbi:MAG: potassium/proton antiporter [Planctomycetaceae bacterium]
MTRPTDVSIRPIKDDPMEMDIPTLTAITMSAGGFLLAVSCLLSRVGTRLGVPVSLLFLAVGMLAGCDGPLGIEFRNFELSHIVGTFALAVVLFAGGMQTPVRGLKEVVAPASVLATVGVLLIAGIVSFAANFAGLPWTEACLVGAIVSSTDASAVFSLLHGVRLPLRVARTLELESGLNDPVAVILTLAMTSQLLGEWATPGELALQVVQQLTVGLAFGILLGVTARSLLRHVPLSTPALIPVLAIGFALIAFGTPSMLGGSGFLAAYLAGMIVGNTPLPARQQMLHVHESLAWLSQVSMFLLLGLLINPSELPRVAFHGTVIALVLAFVARPIAVFLCLLPFRFDLKEKLFISWSGLRGAVPIVMATVPVLRAETCAPHMVEALDVFDLVFFVVVIGSIVPGSMVQRAAKWLGLESRTSAEPCQCDELPLTQDQQGTADAASGLWERLWRPSRLFDPAGDGKLTTAASTGTLGKNRAI